MKLADTLHKFSDIQKKDKKKLCTVRHISRLVLALSLILMCSPFEAYSSKPAKMYLPLKHKLMDPKRKETKKSAQWSST